MGRDGPGSSRRGAHLGKLEKAGRAADEAGGEGKVRLSARIYSKASASDRPRIGWRAAWRMGR
jgi:hypothetical protein